MRALRVLLGGGLLLLVGCSARGAVAPAVGDAGTPDADKTRPAREVYRNIKIFTRDAVSAEFLDELMSWISRDLGVSCAYCHDPSAMHRDDLGPRKRLARATVPTMWAVVSNVNKRYFPGTGGLVTCWSCHRGSPAPERVAPEPAPLPVDADPFALPRDGASNLQVLGDLTPAELRRTMRSIASSLGLRCRDCHVVGDWAGDARPQKVAAREMLSMTAWLESAYFEPGRGPTCWTCHRGSSKVPTRPR